MSTSNGCLIVPRPLHYSEVGAAVVLASSAMIGWAGAEAQGCAELLAEYLRPATGFAFPVKPLGEAADAAIRLKQTGTAVYDNAGFCNERYTLCTCDGGVQIEAETGAGLARGLQTLRQLLPAAIFSDKLVNAEWVIPGVKIEDQPQVRWRGLHLDVCRHFFSVAEVCRYIDLLALHRMSTFHIHLTEDQGWRIEIKRYPKLTEVGAYREESLVGLERARPRKYDGKPYGGFYTQDDIRQIVKFAARRHITIIPEIDMPGHMQAAIAAYPELGNFDIALKPRCHWGISQNILNAEESTVEFMCNVLDEVMALFPGRFIHVGGDEALKTEWSEGKRAHELMIERGLKNEDELQSWFIRKLAAHIESRGRRCIGWDEILEGGLAEGAAVMSWRGEEGGLAAAQQGHDVVFAPHTHTYFDHYQDFPESEHPLAIGGMTPLSKVYSYTPFPAALSEEQKKLVLGGQGQLWTEYIPDMKQLEYMAYPRTCALAEILWLPAKEKNYQDFHRRLSAHRARLQAMQVNAYVLP